MVAKRLVNRVLSLASSAALALAFIGQTSAQTSQPVSFYASIDSPIAMGYALGAPVAIDLNGDGKLDLVGTNGPLRLGANDVAVMLGNGDGTFQPPVNYPVGFSPGAVQVGDVNGDGIPDLVVCDSDVNNNGTPGVSVLLGNGDGTFQPQIMTALPQGNYPTSLALGDFNGDGKLDVAVNGAPVPHSYNYGLTVLLGNGDGTFQPAVIYNTGPSATMVAAGDFNGDGKLDLVTADYNNGGNVSVLLGNGDGTFQSAIVSSAGAVPTSGSFVVADLNMDGKLDVAVGNSILLGNGDGTFKAPAPAGPDGCTVDGAGDLNGDGVLDLVAVIPANANAPRPESASALILLGNGDGTFHQSATFPVLENTVVLGDANGDGGLDVITTDVSVTFGNGDGTFEAQPEISNGLTNDDSYFVLAADMNGDGRPDLVETLQTGYNQTQSFALGVMLADNSGLSPPVITSLGSGIDHNPWMAADDFNGDGRMDLAISEDGQFAVLLGKGDGTFQPARNYTPPLFYIATGDFNGDGKLDLVGIDPNNNIDVHLGNGDGTFGEAIVSGIGTCSFCSFGNLVLADFNGDGKLDIAIGGSLNLDNNPAPLCLLLGKGDGTFQTPVQLAPLSIWQAEADFNGDGNPDIAFIGMSGVEVLLGNGNGTFQNPVTTPASVDSISVGDFNGDGKPDLVGFSAFSYDAGGGTSGVSILLGNGDGTFQPQSPTYGVNLIGVEGGIDEFDHAASLAIADFDGDGTLDVAAGTFNGTVALLYNRPAGSGISLNPGTLSLGNQPVGSSSSAQPVSLTNVGLSALTISSITITGPGKAEFSQSNTCGDSVRAGRSCAISVKFTPSASGLQTATLMIEDNAKESPHTVALSGMGTSLGLVVASGSSGTATVAAGQTAKYTLSIGGAGMSGTATVGCTGAPTGADCTFPGGTSVNVNAMQASPFTVQVTTTSRTMAAALPNRTMPWRWMWPIAGFVLLPGSIARKRPGRRAVWVLPFLMLVLLCACGGGGSSTGGSGSSNPNGTPAGTYKLTVTATLGSTQESIPLTLTVQ